MSNLIYYQQLPIHYVRKNVKHMRLSVRRADGQVKLTLPLFASRQQGVDFIAQQWLWIQKQQLKSQQQRLVSLSNEATFVAGALFYLWGKAYPLTIHWLNNPETKPTCLIQDKQLCLHTPMQASQADKEQALLAFYRHELQQPVSDLIQHWSQQLGVQVTHCSLRQMRSRWGSCTPAAGRIRLNIQLAKYDRSLLDYVVLHELAHLIEANHSAAFKAILDQHQPQWRQAHRTLQSYVL